MKQTPAIIAVDLDGTVFGADHKTIPPGTKHALEQYIENGTALIPVTGRIESMIPIDSFPAFRYLISSNGGYITDLLTRQVLRSRYIPHENVQKAWEMVKDRVESLHIVMELYVDDRIVIERKVYDRFPIYEENLPPFHREYIQTGKAELTESFDEYLQTKGDRVVKINFPGQSIRHCPELREELVATGLFQVTSDGLNLELNAPGCHKGEALQWLSEQLGIQPEKIVAFGNGDNDISMLMFAGFGVAMDNSLPSVKAAANYVTAANTEDGIAAFLGRHFPLRSDLLRARELLHSSNYTCVFCKDDSIITDSRRGVDPLLALLDVGSNLSGFSAADKVVGKAAAFLYCLLEVREIYASVISRMALEVLRAQNIPVEYGQIVDAIRNRANTGFCPMETAVKDIEDPQEALKAIRATKNRLLS